jgi:hypothetical protein
MIPKSAWFPLTPRGVAAFAPTGANRLWLVQFLFAVIAAVTVGWFVTHAWTPTIRAAIEALPDSSRITRGALEWPAESPKILAEGRFLAFAVDQDHRGEVATSSDIVVELGRNDWQLTSLFGALDLPGLLNTSYPPGYTIALNRTELGPWWGAREPFLVAISMGLTGLGLLLSWTVLATLYAPLVWLGAFYANRAASLAGCWKLSGAALMPGVLFLCAAIAFYGLGAFSLLQLALAFAMHFVVSWFYLATATACLPRHPDTKPAGENPFGSTPPAPPK